MGYRVSSDVQVFSELFGHGQKAWKKRLHQTNVYVNMRQFSKYVASYI